jgi:hypothetical protein
MQDSKLKKRFNADLSRPAALAARQYVVATTGLTQNTFYRYLRGDSNDQRIGMALARFLGITFEQLHDPDFPLPNVHITPAPGPSAAAQQPLNA